MNFERTDIAVGATSRIAKVYLEYLDILRIPSIAVSRSGSDDDFTKYKHVQYHMNKDLADTDWQDLKEIICSKEFPRVVYFATRHNHLGGHKSEYHAINVDYVKRLTEFLSKEGIPFLYLSTDLVFGGDGEAFGEDDTPLMPWSYYGVTKREGEKETLKHRLGKVMRIGNVLGVDGDYVSVLANKLNSKEKYGAWANIFNRFAGINDVCWAINEVADYPGKQKIFHIASSEEPMSRYEVAKRLVDHMEVRGILPQGSSQFLLESEHKYNDGRPKTLNLQTEITQKELGFKPSEIVGATLERVLLNGYPYLRSNNSPID